MVLQHSEVVVVVFGFIAIFLFVLMGVLMTVVPIELDFWDL